MLPRLSRLLIIVSAALVLGLCLVGGWHWWQTGRLDKTTYTHARLTVDQQTFTVRVADSPAKQTKGLAGTTSLAENEGMYFPLDPSTSHAFWMKGMVIPIDIIWIKQGIVVGVNANVPHPSITESENNLPIYNQPVEQVDGVLEIKSGRAEELQIKVGSQVEPLAISQLD